MDACDVLIVGAGPIGIELAAGLKGAGLLVMQVEAGQVGSTLEWWAPGTRFFSSPERIEIAGVPLVTPTQDKATREEYLAYLRQVVGARGLEVRAYTRVVGIEREGDGFRVRLRPSLHGVGGPAEYARAKAAEEGGAPERGAPTRGGAARDGSGPEREVFAHNVVLAIGNMHRPRLVRASGEDLPHVTHYMGDPHVYAGRRVLIVGGKNSAVEAAIRLHRVGARVTISYRRGRLDPDRIKYWLLPEIEWLIRKGRIGFLHCTEVIEIGPDSVTLERVGGEMDEVCGGPDPADLHDRQLERGEDDEGWGASIPGRAAAGLTPGQRIEVGADAVLLMTGYVQDPSLFEVAGVELLGEERRPRHDPETMETNVPGLYVAGTACGGSQRRTRVFIETSHAHVDRIVHALTGVAVEVREPPMGLEES